MKVFIKVRATDFVVYPYTEGTCPSLEEILTSYEEIMPTEKLRELSKKEFFRYDKDRKKLHLPKCIGFKTIQLHLLRNNITTSLVNGRDELIIPRDAHRLTLKDGIRPKDEIQSESIDFLLGRGVHADTKGRQQKLLELATGYGKTFVTIASICELKQRIVVLCPIGKVSKQWQDSFIKFTNVPRRRIKFIEGTKNLMYEGLKTKIKTDVFIISLSTAKILAEESPHIFTQIMHNIGPGMLVRDECHLHIKAIIRIDTNVSCDKNVYLSATAMRDSAFENRVFQMIFSKMPRYGIHTHYIDPAVNIVAVFHKMELEPKLLKKCHPFALFFKRDAYANIFITKKRKEYDTLVFSIIDPLTKCLADNRSMCIFFGRTDEIDVMYEVMKLRYPNKTVGRYHSKMANKKEKETAEEADIILTTAGSLGTGSDIHGLKYQVDFYPIKGEGNTIQRIGRTREIKGEEVYYIAVYNTAISYFMKAVDTHKELLVDRIKSWTEKFY